MDSPEMGSPMFPEKGINLDIQNTSTVQFADIMMIQWFDHDTCVQPRRCLYIHLKFQVSLCLARIARQTCSQYCCKMGATSWPSEIPGCCTCWYSTWGLRGLSHHGCFRVMGGKDFNRQVMLRFHLRRSETPRSRRGKKWRRWEGWPKKLTKDDG